MGVNVNVIKQINNEVRANVGKHLGGLDAKTIGWLAYPTGELAKTIAAKGGRNRVESYYVEAERRAAILTATKSLNNSAENIGNKLDGKNHLASCLIILDALANQEVYETLQTRPGLATGIENALQKLQDALGKLPTNGKSLHALAELEEARHYERHGMPC